MRSAAMAVAAVLRPALLAVRPAHRMTEGSIAGQDLGELFELYAPPRREDVPLPSGTAPRPLGVRKPRGEVHRDGDWHRSVHIWIADGDGRLLCQLRGLDKDTHPGRWDVSCAGHITAGDGSLDTAARELEEARARAPHAHCRISRPRLTRVARRQELGLSVRPDELRDCWLCTIPSAASGATEKHGPFTCKEFQDMYLLRRPGLSPASLALGAAEVADARLFDGSELLRAWEGADPAFVPRPAHYRRALAAAMPEY